MVTRWEQSNPSFMDQANVVYDPTIKINGLILETQRLGKEQSITCYMIVFVSNLQTRQIYEDRV